MESTESRYAHLLQPIRELTKNWEIDVASELNDYLEELDEMCITLDGGKTRLNFAEAALLIQGSTCIYSKKVELLHTLVYQTLQYINNKSKKRSKEAAEALHGAAGATQMSHDAEDVDEFTPLETEVCETFLKSDLDTIVNVVPLPPESLIPPETHEKNKLPLISVKGEVVCSQKDFRINLFIPGQEDLILLMSKSAAASRFLLDQNLEPIEMELPAEAASTIPPDDAAENFLPINEDMDLDQDPEEHIERQQVSSQAQSEGRMIRERRDLEVEKQNEMIPAAVETWTLHDPYSVNGEDKPFKPGKCYKVPNGLDDGGKRKRRRPALLQDFRTWFSGTFDPPEPKLKVGPTFPDLNYIYLSFIKDKVKKQKRICRRAGVVMSEEELRRTFLQPEEVEPVDEFRHAELSVHPLRFLLLLGAKNSDPVTPVRSCFVLMLRSLTSAQICPGTSLNASWCGAQGGDDDSSDIEHDGLPDDIPPEITGGPDFISPEAQRDDLTYEELVQLRVEQLLVHSLGYTQETALSRRVKDWEDKIQPQLVLQEERPPFDIHDYGGRIVRNLSSVGCRRSFASIVRGLDNFEACKYLLASLQLANDFTVEIDSAAGLEDSLDTMSLTLLSTHRATDRFKTLTTSS
ncbi:condensin-2 complex subunit H2 isoform X2 [Girardinichthys multiradiatus]|nr:condensin-2 complex subunit H2 isoform X2 [Girardinichthys multiradiatus]XP_047245861.1 condensin-2 complex subunit H2 isoform X2 [Girardinichthys multiradiatus]XP_047245862.1 condensin-2 complex subunit H2 isoform X2 [Girardinichthys multiradiatus]